MEDIKDDYKEHELHKRPFWRTMKICSECYKEHQASVNRLHRRSSNNYQPQFNSPSEAGIAI